MAVVLRIGPPDFSRPPSARSIPTLPTVYRKFKKKKRKWKSKQVSLSRTIMPKNGKNRKEVNKSSAILSGLYRALFTLSLSLSLSLSLCLSVCAYVKVTGLTSLYACVFFLVAFVNRWVWVIKSLLSLPSFFRIFNHFIWNLEMKNWFLLIRFKGIDPTVSEKFSFFLSFFLSFRKSFVNLSFFLFSIFRYF